MSEREEIIERMVTSMQTVNDDLHLPFSIWVALADAALSVIETPASTHYEVKRCTCSNDGYTTKHELGCELWS